MKLQLFVLAQRQTRSLGAKLGSVLRIVWIWGVSSAALSGKQDQNGNGVLFRFQNTAVGMS